MLYGHQEVPEQHHQTTDQGVADNHPGFLCEFDCTMGFAAGEPCDCRRWLGLSPAGYTPEAVCDCCGDETLTPKSVAATDADEIFCKGCLEGGLLDV